MNPTVEDINAIKKVFGEIETREHLLMVLNYAKTFVYGKDVKPFKLNQITYYGNPKRSKANYKSFEIKKKSGEVRTIMAPEKGLKAIQKSLSFVLQCVFEPHPAATGFSRNKSIVDNAKLHYGSNYVYNVDLKDFFSSIDQARVWTCLKLHPFNLTAEFSTKASHEIEKTVTEKIDTGIRYFVTDHNEKIYYKVDSSKFQLIKDKKGQLSKYVSRLLNNLVVDENMSIEELAHLKRKTILSDAKRHIETKKNKEQLKRLSGGRIVLANLIAGICCAEQVVERQNDNGEWVNVKRSVLPQGAPTSPVLSNVVCQRLDFLLSGVAKRFGLRYSRYADDITFSSMHDVYDKDGEFIMELNRIITQQGFHIKQSKVRLQKVGDRQEVTGLLVNKKVNVQKRYVKQIRMWLYYWETYGYVKAEEIFKRDYQLDKGHVKKGVPNLANVLDGKLEYLRMVKGTEDTTYQGLKGRFDNLVSDSSPISKLLDIWEFDGIEKAMDMYYDDKLVKMARNKYDFIRELLEDKKINQNQRERILELASREISLEGTLEERVQKIEEILFDNIPVDNETTINISNDNSKQNTDYEKIKKYYKSQDLYNFLKDFHQNYFILKPTSHTVDSDDLNGICEYCEIEEYNHEIILSKIKIDYENLQNRYKKKFVSKNMTALIWTYLFGGRGKEWDTNITINWSSPELIDWCRNNTGIPPNPDSDICNEKLTQGFVFQEPIQPESKLLKQHGVIKNDINNFRELCIHFKHLFHIRADNQLKDIIKNNIINVSPYSEWEVNLKGIDFLEYYTDVSKLIQLTENIFHLINNALKDHADLDQIPKINLSFKDLNSFIEFKIHHINTVFKRPKNELNRSGKTLSSIIKNQVNGIGEFELMVEINTGEIYEIKCWNWEIWNNGGDFKVEQKIDSHHKGVAYILKMKK